MLKSIINRIGRKTWAPEQVRKYVGTYRNVYFTHSTRAFYQAQAASGGSVTGLLGHLLESGVIDGALVLRSVIEDGRVQMRFVIARTPDELRQGQGSKYMAVHFRRDALPLLKAFPGRLAVVALPCDATALKKFREQDAELDRKIQLVIALVCGHNSERELTDHVTRTLGKGHGELTDYRYRRGHWRGELTATYADGAEIKRPFEYFSDYRNLYMFAQEKCHHCFDHYGYHCDISAGDIWSLYLRNDPIKYTAMITRSDAGENALRSASDAGALKIRQEAIEEVLDGQSRTMPYHYNVTVRHRVGKLFGMKIKDKVGEEVRWNDYIVAFMGLYFQKYSNTPLGRRIIFMIPRKVIRGVLVFFKALETI